MNESASSTPARSRFSSGHLAASFIAAAYFWYYVATYADWHFIDNVDLIFHEAGHAIFMFFGEFIHVAAGSAFQIALPLFFVGYFWWREQPFSASLVSYWVGVNLLNVSLYAGDAVRMQLPLLGGDGVMHDWNYLLSTTNLITHTATVAAVLYFLGVCAMALATLLSFRYSFDRSLG